MRRRHRLPDADYIFSVPGPASPCRLLAGTDERALNYGKEMAAALHSNQKLRADRGRGDDRL